MASFLSILKKVWGGVEKAEPLIGTVLSSINPAAGAIFNTLTNAITGAERFYSAPKSGTQKAAFVVQNFEQGLAVAQEIFAARGESLAYDPKALQNFIDAQVAAMNALAILHSSLTTTKVPTPVGVTGPVAPVAAPAPVAGQASTFLDPAIAKVIGL